MDRKDLVRQYKETPRPAGLYRVRHTPSGRFLLGSTPDAPAMLNRVRAQLRLGGHPNRTLRQDWETDGPEAFEFEVLDLLPPSDDPDRDLADELGVLEEMWRETLSAELESEY